MGDDDIPLGLGDDVAAEITSAARPVRTTRNNKLYDSDGLGDKGSAVEEYNQDEDEDYDPTKLCKEHGIPYRDCETCQEKNAKDIKDDDDDDDDAEGDNEYDSDDGFVASEAESSDYSTSEEEEEDDDDDEDEGKKRKKAVVRNKARIKKMTDLEGVIDKKIRLFHKRVLKLSDPKEMKTWMKDKFMRQYNLYNHENHLHPYGIDESGTAEEQKKQTEHTIKELRKMKHTLKVVLDRIKHGDSDPLSLDSGMVSLFI